MSEIIESNVYNFRNDVILFNIESNHYNPLKGLLCEFSAFLLDKEDLSIKDKYNVFLKLDELTLNSVHKNVKKLHEGKWDIYTKEEKPDDWDDSWRIIEQDDFIMDFFEWIEPHYDEKKLGNFISVSWDSVMSNGFIQNYLYRFMKENTEIDMEYIDKYDRLFVENIDLKSLYRALFMISGVSYNKSSLTETMNHFGIDEETKYGIERCEVKLELFRVFCDFGIRSK